MANTSLRCMNRAVFSSLTKRITSSKTAVALAPSSTLPSSTTSAVSRSSVRRFLTVSRTSSALGCCSGSLLPMHTAVAVARLTSRLSLESRSCRALSQGS
ncbi:hypothetical protein HPP92_025465 [Vanilla planifolia]|uniref:Uncharacterized protein n=1 Tax=Vanilla planifolia TaxID=51239 RepID=A0A835UB26_VANPL|nr:hypothetical protein HPP92_025465 [Vanilla planifolia]